MKHTSLTLVHAAMTGIIGGAACGGSPSQPAIAESAAHGDKAGCGNHEPGKCAAVDPKQTAAQSDHALSIARTETIAPGKAFELNLSFSTTSQVKATFKAGSPLTWNVHSHPAGGMVEHQKGAGAVGDVAFQPSTPGVYSFLWKNDGTAPVTIDVSLTGDRGVSELSE